jgi:hypothetical protein
MRLAVGAMVKGKPEAVGRANPCQVADEFPAKV